MKIYRNLTAAVVDALTEIFVNHRYADKVIERMLKQHPVWGARDRRFVAETTYEIVRWYRFLKASVDDTQNNFWQILGAYLVWKKWPLPSWEEFAGVSAPNVRAHQEELTTQRAIRESIPDWLDARGVAELSGQWETELHALNQMAAVVLRVNTLKTSREQLQRRLVTEDEIETSTDKRFPDALILQARTNVFSKSSFKDGMFEVQDAGSQLIAPFLDAQPGMRVIDACAGAGGKSLHLAALMKNKGRILAMDTEEWKLTELKKRSRRAGTDIIEPRLISSAKVIKRLEDSADRLLLDVPCSGSGVLRRNPDTKWKLNEERLTELQTIQADILSKYSKMVKPGGALVYATCSIFPSENNQQVDAFLEKEKSFRLVESRTLLPHEGFDGFFMARIERIS